MLTVNTVGGIHHKLLEPSKVVLVQSTVAAAITMKFKLKKKANKQMDIEQQPQQHCTGNSFTVNSPNSKIYIKSRSYSHFRD